MADKTREGKVILDKIEKFRYCINGFIDTTLETLDKNLFTYHNYVNVRFQDQGTCTKILGVNSSLAQLEESVQVNWNVDEVQDLHKSTEPGNQPHMATLPESCSSEDENKDNQGNEPNELLFANKETQTEGNWEEYAQLQQS